MSGGRLAGKNAVITGASGGMGQVACRMFCEEGASVLGVDVAEDSGRRLEAELRADDLEFAYLQCDLTSSEAVAELAREVEARFGGLDVLYNNAGIIKASPLVETTDEDWDRILSVNLRGPFLMMRALVPLMHGRAGASIVNIASGLALIAETHLAAYCASKGGLVQLTKSAALELGPEIRVNAICPGVIDTPMPQVTLAGLPPDLAASVFQGWQDTHVAGRLGRPEEVVAVAVFLSSDEASFITGAAIPVDSGVTAR